MYILAVETSCDETAAAVLQDGRTVLSSVVLSQIEEHRLYGGVVPEIASRRHVENISQVVDSALAQAGVSLSALGGVAVTAGPGLVGALLVGVNFAKALCYSGGIPLIPVHHVRGHVAANYITFPELAPPFICLIVSGGHSHIVEVLDYCRYKIIGRTLDDAAGEAFDKVARAVGLPYPGGAYIDRAAVLGDPNAYALPTPRTENPFDFSFSGLKTAVVNLLHNAQQKGEVVSSNDLAASFQAKVVEILSSKLMAAAKAYGHSRVALAGGVAANSGLRERLVTLTQKEGYQFYYPPLELCGDNAAMIGSQGYYELKSGNVGDSTLNAYATLSIEDPAFL